MACRLCLCIFENESEYSEMSQHQDHEFLVNFLFEVLDMEISTAPLICKSCKIFTDKIHRFLEDCLAAQNRLYDYRQKRGLNKLSNEDLMCIAKDNDTPGDEHDEIDGLEEDSQVPDTVETVIDDFSVESPVILKIASSDNNDPTLFQYVIEIGQENEELIKLNEEMGSSPEATVPDMLDYNSLKVHSDIVQCSQIEENFLSTISVCNQIKNENYIQTNQEVLSDLEVSEFNSSDPKIFECHQTELEVLEFHQNDDSPILDCSENESGILGDTQILEYDQISSEILGYNQSELEILGQDKNSSSLEDSMNYPKVSRDKENEKNYVLSDFVCHICQAQFKTKRGIANHIVQKHKQDEVFKCSFCGYEANYKTYLERHIKHHHSDEGKVKMHQCPKCPYCTPRKDTLQVHLKFVHTDKRELDILKCELCSYETIRKSNLTSHMKYKHSEQGDLETLYCSLCSYQTVRSKYLQYHMKYQHSSHGRMQLKFCTMCDYKTYKDECMKAHCENEHPNGNNLKLLKCPMCKYETLRKASMKLHIKCKHKKEECEQLTCQKCDYQTYRKDAFRVHLKFMHLEDKELEMYKCEWCEYQTVRKLDLQRHTKCKHSEKSLQLNFLDS